MTKLNFIESELFPPRWRLSGFPILFYTSSFVCRKKCRHLSLWYISVCILAITSSTHSWRTEKACTTLAHSVQRAPSRAPDMDTGTTLHTTPLIITHSRPSSTPVSFSALVIYLGHISHPVSRLLRPLA